MRRAWSSSSVACLTALHGRDLRELDHRLRLDVHDDPLRDVVDDDRPVAGRGDRLEVLDDPARRRLVVVRRDDEEAVDAELVRLLGEVHGVGRRVRARAGDHGRPLPHLVDGRGPELELLVVGQRRRLAGRRGDDEPVRAAVDHVARERAEPVVVDGAVLVERRHDRRQNLAEHRGHPTRRSRFLQHWSSGDFAACSAAEGTSGGNSLAHRMHPDFGGERFSSAITFVPSKSSSRVVRSRPRSSMKTRYSGKPGHERPGELVVDDPAAVEGHPQQVGLGGDDSDEHVDALRSGAAP